MPESSLTSNLVSTIVSLVFVLALAWVMLRLLKRWQSGQAMKSADDPSVPRVVHSVALGPRERLITVAYQDKTLLLGVTGSAIQLIDTQQTHPDQHAT